jgi:DNA-binding NarL/FixJ family response regulator
MNERQIRTPSDLPTRQQQILRMIAEGETTIGIALELGLSPKTVEYHRLMLERRTGIYDIAGLTKLAIRLGMIENPCTKNRYPGNGNQ